MKTSNRLVLFAILLLASIFTSCSTTLNFLNSTVVPAAEGYAKFSKDDNANYAIKLKVTNLAEPTRLQPKKELYVVWLVTDDNLTKNIGALNSSKGFFSDLLTGELNTVSSSKPLYFFITAEDVANVTSPNGTIVLTTSKN